ncbi:MAG TPA: HEAT repeat domain-containing protein, partial [Geobacteraceae bacterium]
MVKELEILTEQLRSPDEETRRLAVVGFSGYPFEQVKDALFSAMGDESWRVRKEAVDTLLAIPFTPDIAEALIQMLRSQDNAGMRNSAVETLERLGGIALPTLSSYIDDDDQDVRKFVIDIMGVVCDPDTVPLLIKALSDPDPNVCAAAAENLGKIGDARSMPYLLRALEKPELWLRYAILEALSKIGKPVPFSSVAPLAGENFLKKAVFDCLGVIGDSEAIPLLIDGLQERARSNREAAAIALMKIKERLPPDALQSSLVMPLKSLAGTTVVDGLVASLEASDKSLKESIVTILGMIGDTRAIGYLLHGCRDDRLRQQCLVAFRNMGDGGINSLLEVFSSADDDERCLIVYVCGELGCRECEPQLREGMHDPYYLLRKVAVIAAGKIGLTGVIGEIAYLLDDTEPEVRDSAIEVLSRFAKEDAE